LLNKGFFIFLFCFCFSQKIIHDFGDKKLVDFDFYFENQKNSWDELSFDAKKKSFDGFLKKELALYFFEKKGLDLNPSVFIKLKEREKQLAVNLYYETFVVGEKINPSYLSLIKKNIHKELYVYHILLGYKGCALPSSFLKTKEEVFTDASLYYKDIKTLFASLSVAEKTSLFSKKAKTLSQDPGVLNNGGLLGWVFWGRSVDSFQVPVFSLKEGGLSEPILTPYGYHLVYVEKERPSNFSYYDPLVLGDQLVRFGLQSLSVDSLRLYSSNHDKNLLSDGGFALNSFYVENFLSLFAVFLNEKKTRFSKKALVDFISQFEKKDVLFVFKNKGFGLKWFLEQIKKTPTTRVSPFSSLEELRSLLSTFVLQEEVFLLAKKEGLLASFYFKKEFKKHKKNMVFNDYIKYKNSQIKKIDSSFVVASYEKGLKDSVFYFPEKALVKEIKSSSEAYVDSAYSFFIQSKDFDLVFSRFGEKKDENVLKSVSRGSKGFLGEVVFSLKKGKVSKKIKNTDKTFSLVQVVDFIPKKQKNLALVYSQIEKKIIKEKEDSIKTNLLRDLKKSSGFSFNYKEL